MFLVKSTDQINSSYSYENDKMLNGVMKTEYGFQGFTQNSGTSDFGANLVNAVNSGSDMATRTLAAWYLLGQDTGYPAVNFDAWNNNAAFNQHVNVQSNHAAFIRRIDAASTVLLKKSSGRPNGYTDRGGDDGVLGVGWGSGTANFPYLVSPLNATKTRSSADGTVVSSSSSDTDLTADSGEGYITVEGNAGDHNSLSAWGTVG
ncbi:hypothetical protein C8R47DRAFT_1229294 [Mycena vitilis]|nr:hypothetical protein C8R47DRAFT_1229294 [Mycena vitilis]